MRKSRTNKLFKRNSFNKSLKRKKFNSKSKRKGIKKRLNKMSKKIKGGGGRKGKGKGKGKGFYLSPRMLQDRQNAQEKASGWEETPGRREGQKLFQSHQFILDEKAEKEAAAVKKEEEAQQRRLLMEVGPAVPWGDEKKVKGAPAAPEEENAE
jgi:hypothetical protein